MGNLPGLWAIGGGYDISIGHSSSGIFTVDTLMFSAVVGSAGSIYDGSLMLVVLAVFSSGGSEAATRGYLVRQAQR
jgi:hypothetical protein